jgi:hypothetical protein
MHTKSPRHLGMKRDKSFPWLVARTILKDSRKQAIPFARSHRTYKRAPL